LKKADTDLGFLLDRTSGKSLTTQIVDGIRWSIHSGRLKTGETLPSREALMRILGVSKNVIQTAVARLASEGLVCPRPHLGCTVLGKAKRLVRGRVLSVLAQSEGAYSPAVFSETLVTSLRSAGIGCTRVSVPREADGRVDTAWLAAELALKPDLAVIEACGHSAPTVVRLLERSGIPYVLLFAKRRQRGSHCLANVLYDTVPAISAFAEDCRRVKILSATCVGFGSDSLVDPTLKLKAAGVSVERLDVPLGAVFNDLNAIQRAARRLMENRLRRGPLGDLVFVTDDYLTFGVLGVLLEHGVRIPDDVRLVTLGNGGFGPVYAKTIARIDFDSRAYAADLAEAVVSWFESGRFPADLCFTPRYVQGESFPIK